jgi:hypothetical protein
MVLLQSTTEVGLSGHEVGPQLVSDPVSPLGDGRVGSRADRRKTLTVCLPILHCHQHILTSNSVSVHAIKHLWQALLAFAAHNLLVRRVPSCEFDVAPQSMLIDDCLTQQCCPIAALVLSFHDAHVVEDHCLIDQRTLNHMHELQRQDQYSPPVFPPSKTLLHIKAGGGETVVKQMFTISLSVGVRCHDKVILPKPAVSDHHPPLAQPSCPIVVQLVDSEHPRVIHNGCI